MVNCQFRGDLSEVDRDAAKDLNFLPRPKKPVRLSRLGGPKRPSGKGRLLHAVPGCLAQTGRETRRGMPEAEVGRKTAKNLASWSAEEPLCGVAIMPELAPQFQCARALCEGFPQLNPPRSPAKLGVIATAPILHFPPLVLISGSPLLPLLKLLSRGFEWLYFSG